MLGAKSEAARRGAHFPLALSGALARVGSRAGRVWSFRAGLLAAVLCLGCGDDEESIGDLARISGTVRDEASGTRLKGAKVVFTADTLESYEARTNEDGEYDLTVDTRSPNGRIEATKSGYQARTVSVFLDDNTVQIDVDLPHLPSAN